MNRATLLTLLGIFHVLVLGCGKIDPPRNDVAREDLEKLKNQFEALKTEIAKIPPATPQV